MRFSPPPPPAARRAFLRLFGREQMNGREPFTGSYLAFRRRIKWNGLNGCWMVQLQGIWLGIERDGYTHS
ncbi:hypothetical protein [Sphingosinicella sp. BN140058]|uniref:hypothetical protein n=1 Tax=Sphingosinicella sp. BN140058 TaxID=1892855 RepID=UPI0010116105|nr:hypothetical protein [Sphingosinicella sp. BN140058]QAY80304.1 hypothetical protein ETR14_27050 [Sphingosinicella sp. BN140058]